MLELEIARAPPTDLSAREGAAQACIFTVLNMKSENFGENLNIHAGGTVTINCEFSLPRLRVW